MKKILSMMLVAVLLVSCMTAVASASAVGDTVTINFTVSNNPGFANYNITIVYDAEALTLTEISQGKLASNGVFIPNKDAGKVGFMSVSDITGDGVLFSATFEITDKAKAGATYNVTTDVTAATNAANKAVTLNITGGSITIDECTHNLVEDKTQHKDATCDEAGYEFWACTKCTYTEERKPEAKGHDWEVKEVVASTCTTLGHTDYVCKNDSSHTKTEDATEYGDHEWELKKEVASTCTTLGYKYYECKHNSEHTKTEYATAYGDHEWGEDGKCKNCSAEKPSGSTPGTPGTTVTPGTSTAPSTDKLPFNDVKKSDWYYESVKYVYENGLMNGTGNGLFSPNASTTRGMIVTILARLEGVDTTKGANWYEAGQKWAMANGISDGTNMTGEMTREQLATMLYRYAQMKGYSTSASASLNGYTDASSVSDWAKEAMQWAVGVGLINGRTSTTLAPQGTATRAEVATILMRFIEKYA